MTLSIIGSFWIVSFLFVITPGVDWAYAIAAGTRGKVVVPAVSGMLLGHLTATMVVAAGIGALVTRHPITLTIIVIIGALYLLWMGWNLIHKPSKLSSHKDQASGTWVSWLTKGTFVSGLNPKVFLLYLALLPQFTDPSESWSISSQIVTLGLVHILSSAVIYLLVGFGAQTVLQSRPVVAQIVSRVSGVLMIMIALVLLSDQAFT
ncbi:LysE family translocator [uncultured Psychromonas sp.]|uniref:LysE family translocator n=1 Tax=uncultured Psychromonas sp. TaxID=173974 RepID=UPI00262BF795|nr:LysE family translocator [uncultured Psychromonas sp.]